MVNEPPAEQTIGVLLEANSIDRARRAARTAVEAGISSLWMSQIFGPDALTVIAVLAAEMSDVRFGTAVVPTYPRHPAMLAAQALTVGQVSGGRFTLGIGLSHRIVIESMFDLSYDRPVRHLREYLDVMLPLLRGEAVDVHGDTVGFHGALDLPADRVPVLVAALGPRMLELAGTLADGSVTWMTGPGTIASHIVPSLRAAAEAGGRPRPRVVMALPTCVTDDPDAARATAATAFEVYGHLPSYRAMLDREGASGPADVAIVGDETAVRAGIERAFEAGADEFVAAVFDNRGRTLDLIASLL